jgi:hypothetical protein
MTPHVVCEVGRARMLESFENVMDIGLLHAYHSEHFRQCKRAAHVCSQPFTMPRPRNLRSLLTTNNARRNSSPAPPSPTFSDITQASAMNFGDNGPAKIITRAHLKASAQAFQEVRPRQLHVRPRSADRGRMIIAHQHECHLSCRAADHVQGDCCVRGCNGEMRRVRSCVWAVSVTVLELDCPD